MALLWSRVRVCAGVKCTISAVLLTILAILILRHRTRVSSPAAHSDWSEPPISVLATIDPDSLPAKPAQQPANLPVAEKPAEPATPVHVHPPEYEWAHTLHTPERRAQNFPLNGENAQFNDEKLTPIFERTRVASLETPGLVTAFFSPGGRLKVSILMSDDGKLGYMLDVARPDTLGSGTGNVVYLPLLAPAFMELNANYKACAFETRNSYGAQVHWQLEFGESWWRPVPGNERRHFHQTYQQAKVWCEGPQCLGCEFLFEYRLYEHALAVRAVVDGASIRDLVVQPQSDAEGEYAHLDFGMGVKLPVEGAKATCWAQSSEDPYLPHTCAEWAEPVMTPVTVVLEAPETKAAIKANPLPYRYLSILQADGPAFMRSTLQTGAGADGAAGLLHVITKGELPIHALAGQLGVIEHPVLGWSTPTSWNVILVGDSSIDLAHQASLVYMLCPPPSPQFPMSMDSRWVVHGKSLRVRGHTTAKAKYMVDFAATYNYQLVHFDAGWYGDENNKSSSPRVVHPPYAKDLSVAEVAGYGRSRSVATTVYVNEIALKDTPELLDIYPRWGLAGIKFGFVNVDTPRAMRILMQRIIAYQHVGMAVNVHDIYRPRGLSRTWPHLVTQEGVRGEERKPDATHHTILPFVRLLQGSADYTPRYLKGALRCTRAHQLALPLIFFSPIQSLFWAEPGQAIVEAVQLYQPELVVWQMIPTTWDDTRYLLGEVGQYVVVARRSGNDWFVGGINGAQGGDREVTINLSDLFDALFDGGGHPLPLDPVPATNKKGYMIHLYEDNHAYAGDRTGTGANDVKVRLRQQFILPAAYSTQIAATTLKAAQDASGGSSFPSDPPAPQWTTAAEYRRKVNLAQEKQLGNQYTKETGKGIPAPTTLKSSLFKVKMAESGGMVMYLSPIL